MSRPRGQHIDRHGVSRCALPARRSLRTWLRSAVLSVALLTVAFASPAAATEVPHLYDVIVECDGDYFESVAVKWRDASELNHHSRVQADPTPELQAKFIGGHGQAVEEFLECLAKTAVYGEMLYVKTTMTVLLESPCWLPLCIYGPSESKFVVSKLISPDDADEIRISTLIDQLQCHDAYPSYFENRRTAAERADDRWDLEGHRPPSGNLLFDWFAGSCNW